MRNLVAAGASAALLVLGAVPAQAASDSLYAGGCGLAAQPSPGGQDVFDGGLYAAVLVYSLGTPGDNLVSATVTCWFMVNGVTQPGQFSIPGTFFISDSRLVSFTATSTDVVEVCTAIDYTSNTTPTVTFCDPWP